jgi:curli biogenesis system outer membrane secretion channel CsgG
VEPFDFSTVKTSVQAIFGTEQNIGAGIRALLVRRLEKAGQFTVVERAKVDAILREQDFGASNRVKQGTNAKIGRIRGAQLLLMGDIVIFGRDDKRRSIKGIGGVWGGAVGGLANVFSEQKAVVGINFRLVDAETTEVLLTEEARGESKRKSKSWGGFLAGAAGSQLRASSPP